MKRQERAELSYEEVGRFFEAIRVRGYPNHRRGFRQIATISPVIAGFAKGMLDKESERRPLLKELRRAIGTYDRASLERARMTVVCDWVIRCAIPCLVEHALPIWGNGGAGAHATAMAFRKRHPVLYPIMLSDALLALQRLEFQLEQELASGIGTGRERDGQHFLRERVSRVLVGLSETLPMYLSTRQLDARDLLWIAGRLAAVTNDHDVSPSSMRDVLNRIRGGVSDVVAVLVSIEFGDTQRSIASRCVWRHVEDSTRRRLTKANVA